MRIFVSSKIVSSNSFIGIDLSRQTNTNILQHINFTEKLGEDNGVAIFFCL